MEKDITEKIDNIYLSGSKYDNNNSYKNHMTYYKPIIRDLQLKLTKIKKLKKQIIDDV
jgi:hypothetical protein